VGRALGGLLGLCLAAAVGAALAAEMPGTAVAKDRQDGEDGRDGERAMASTASDPWDEFCERLKRAGRVLDKPNVPGDELTRAEGYRHLARLVHAGWLASFEMADPERPQILPAVSRHMLGEGETSDARYHQAFIDGASTYRVRGRRGQAPFVEFTVYAGKIGLQDTSRQIGHLLEDDLVVDEDGRFEVVIGPKPHPGSWIRTEPGASLLFVREYSHDWSRTEGASFEIEREDPPSPRAPLGVEEVRQGLLRTADFVDRAVHFWAAIVDARAAAPPNVFFEIPADPDPARPVMPVGHRFAAGYFRLAEEEGLVVRFEPGREVPYWGLDLTNYWFEPLSWGDHRSNVNNGTVRTEADGSVRIWIGDTRAGEANWIDTRGHREGTMLFRWSRTAAPLPTLSAEVVKLSTR